MQSFVQAQQEFDCIQNRVKSLKFQLRDIDQKNYLLCSKLKDLGRVSPHATKSPIAQLQEQLHLDRKQVIEQFKPIMEKEGIYQRNERLKTESYLHQSRINEIQQKKIKVRQIDEYDAEVSRRRAQYQEKKIQEVRKRQILEMEINKLNVQKKFLEISDLRRQEKELNEMLANAKQKEQQLCNKFCNVISSQENSVMLPSIQKSNSRMSQQSNQRSITPYNRGISPFAKGNNRNQKNMLLGVKNDLSMTDTEKIIQKNEQRKKSQSTDQLNNMACQTSFLTSEKQQQESIQYSMQYESYESRRVGVKTGSEISAKKRMSNLRIDSNGVSLSQQISYK